MKRHHDKAPLMRITVNWGWLSGSVIINTGAWQHPGIHGAGGAQSSTFSSEGKLDSWEESLKAYSHSDTLPPTRPHLLIVRSLGQVYSHHHKSL